jgi:hypothetical protein
MFGQRWLSRGSSSQIAQGMWPMLDMNAGPLKN